MANPGGGEAALLVRLSGSSVTWDKTCFVFSVALRPDVKEEALMSLFEQILLSLGGAVRRLLRDEKLESASEGAVLIGPLVLATSSAEHGAWATIRIHIGVDNSLERSAVVVVVPSSAVGSARLGTTTTTA
ncbi:hypothetical protein EON64_16660, partial [archaeon]